MQAQTEDGTFSEIQFCGLKLNIHFPNGKIVSGKLISYHAIKTGLFLWKYNVMESSSLELPISCGIGLSEYRIVKFFCCSQWGINSANCCFLRIKDSNERYGTFEEAYEKNIIPTLTKKVELIERDNYSDGNKAIRLFDYIGDNFFSIPMRAPTRFVAQITEITRQNGSWKILLTGAPPSHIGSDRAWPPRYDPNGSNNRKATFILSDDYEVLDVREESVSIQ